MYLAKREGRQIPYAYGFSFGYLVAGPGDTTGPYAWPEITSGMEGIYMFFPDTCDIAVFASYASEWTGGSNDYLDIFSNIKIMIAAGAGLEGAVYIGPETQGSASPSSFQGVSSTVQAELPSIGGDAYVSNPNADGSYWVGGKIDFAPGIGGAFTDWNLTLVGKSQIPECACYALIYALPGI